MRYVFHLLLTLFLLTACTGGSRPVTEGEPQELGGSSGSTAGASGGLANTEDTTTGEAADGSSEAGEGGVESADIDIDWSAYPDIPEGEITSIEGRWVHSCSLIDPDNPDEGFRIWTLTIENNRFASWIRNFTNPGCVSTSAIYSQVVFQGYFELGEEIVTSGGLKASTIKVVTLEPKLSTEFDIFHISGNKLYFGLTTGTLDGSSESERPDSLDFYWDLVPITAP